MASFHRILSKCDRALVAYLTARNVGQPGQVLPAKRSGDKNLPLIICYSHVYLVLRNTGAYTVQASILIKSSMVIEVGAEETTARSSSDEMVGAVIDALWTIDDDSGWDSKKLAGQVTAAARGQAMADPTNADLADFTAFDVRHMGGSSGVLDDLHAWTETVDLEIDCAPANVD